MKKWILRITLGLLALIVVALVVLFFSLNTLVRSGVVYGGKYATGQDTALNAADLSLTGGTLQLSGLDIANMSGYTAPDILVMKSCAVMVTPSSLLSSTVDVENITIDGLEITLEQNGLKNNLNDLMAAIQKNTAAASGAPGGPAGAAPGNAQSPTPGKQLKIGVLKLTNSKVHVRANGINLDLSLPDLEIKDPTNPDGRYMKIADLVGTILLHISQQIVENPQLPAGIKDGMKNITALVDKLGPQLQKGLTDLSKNVNLQDVGKSLQNATQNMPDLGKGLQGLFNSATKPK